MYKNQISNFTRMYYLQKFHILKKENQNVFESF